MIETVKKYVATLSVGSQHQEEIENVLLGYMTDCEAKDKHIKDLERMTNWQSPETAPKTGEMILADLGWPWASLACWNELEMKWVFANLSVNFVDGKQDPYFENEYESMKNMRGWMPLS